MASAMPKVSCCGRAPMTFISSGFVEKLSCIFELPPPVPTWQTEQFLARVVRVGKFGKFSRRFGKRVGEKPDVLQGAQLIVFDLAVIMHLVHLEFAETQNEVGGATVAGTAFSAARITPGLLPQPVRCATILDASTRQTHLNGPT